MTPQNRPAGARLAFASDFPLIVHSHLRWDFVWQRPQQLLSRMAAAAPVLFVEEPILLDDVRRERLEITEPLPNVFRAVPRLPAYLRDNYDAAVTTTRALVQQAIGRGGALAGRFAGAVQWFYTPMPAPAMLGAFGERGVVYDCMDELAQFRFAPTDLPERERQLMANADVVFTGGHKLYQSKARYHDNVHFFGCGVDAAHFARARAEDTAVPADVASLPRPIMGYYGVIDERLDYELLRTLAAENPDASLVMVGPVVKVDPRDLPRADNIHWLGQRDYQELPSYVKAFDVCLMPFALNEATEYINPTKTLEYMAAAKPIVSTAVADVVHHFTPVVRVARTPAEFVAGVRAAAAAPDAALIERGLQMVKGASWEAIVAQMRGLIVEAVGANEEAAVSSALSAASEWTDRSLGAIRGASAAGAATAARGEELGA